jgi:hypothetical protein
MLEDIDPAAREHATQQYQALGQFVEAFESMVDEVRSSCVEILRRDKDHEYKHQSLLEVPFFHRIMTALPLFDILQALVADLLKDVAFRVAHGISDEDRAAFLGVLSRINSEYVFLASKRNNLLHGTWFIGYSGTAINESEFHIKRYTTSAEGLVSVRDMPKNAPELLRLAKRCEDARDWISLLVGCLPEPISRGGFKIKECFRRDGKTWRCIRWPSICTLPRTFPEEPA